MAWQCRAAVESIVVSEMGPITCSAFSLTEGEGAISPAHAGRSRASRRRMAEGLAHRLFDALPSLPASHFSHPLTPSASVSCSSPSSSTHHHSTSHIIPVTIMTRNKGQKRRASGALSTQPQKKAATNVNANGNVPNAPQPIHAQTRAAPPSINAPAPAPSRQAAHAVLSAGAQSAPVQNRATVKTWKETLTDTTLHHLLVDNTDHEMYSDHFELATEMCMKGNKNGDPWQELHKALLDKAAALNWSAVKTKVAIDRVRTYSLTCQMDVLAAKVKSTAELKTILEALIKTVTGKDGDTIDDPEKAHVLQSALNSMVKGSGEVKKKSKKPKANAEVQAKESDQGTEEGAKKKAKNVEANAEGPVQESIEGTEEEVTRTAPAEEASSLEDKVKHAELCMQILQDEAQLELMDQEERKSFLMDMFKEAQDMYVAYVMSKTQLEYHAAAIHFDTTAVYTGAMKMWEDLADEMQKRWGKRVKKLRKGDNNYLSAYTLDDTVKAVPKPTDQTSTTVHSNTTAPNIIAAQENDVQSKPTTEKAIVPMAQDEKEVKVKEEEDDNEYDPARDFFRDLSIRTSLTPLSQPPTIPSAGSMAPRNAPTGPRFFGSGEGIGSIPVPPSVPIRPGVPGRGRRFDSHGAHRGRGRSYWAGMYRWS